MDAFKASLYHQSLCIILQNCTRWQKIHSGKEIKEKWNGSSFHYFLHKNDKFYKCFFCFLGKKIKKNQTEHYDAHDPPKIKYWGRFTHSHRLQLCHGNGIKFQYSRAKWTCRTTLSHHPYSLIKYQISPRPMLVRQALWIIV